MKVSDFRLGNYIKNIETGKYTLVDMQVMFKLSLNDSSLYEPIEVNEESLLRFGFKKQNEYSFVINSGKLTYALFKMFLPNGDFVLQLSDEFKFVIKYIHGLQNIFYYLTNNELQLEH